MSLEEERRRQRIARKGGWENLCTGNTRVGDPQRVDQGSFYEARRLKIFGINIDTRTRQILEEGRGLEHFSNI